MIYINQVNNYPEYKFNNGTEYIKFRENTDELKEYYDEQFKGLMHGLLIGDEEFELKSVLNKYFKGDEVLRDQVFEIAKERKVNMD